MRIRDLFEGWAPHYEKTFSLPVLRAFEREEISRVLEVTRVRGKRVLDIGCGYGKYSGIWEREGARLVVGLDFSPGMIRRARERHPGSHYLVGDAFSPPFRDQCFDLVTCIGVANYYRDVGPLLGEMARLSRGEVILTFPHRSLLGRVYSLLSRVPIYLKDRAEAEALLRPYLEKGDFQVCARGLTLIASGRVR
jgi:ubiquinone/menaquinone biosynthesis C-methylase UbiE